MGWVVKEDFSGKRRRQKRTLVRPRGRDVPCGGNPKGEVLALLFSTGGFKTIRGRERGKEKPWQIR